MAKFFSTLQKGGIVASVLISLGVGMMGCSQPTTSNVPATASSGQNADTLNSAPTNQASVNPKGEQVYQATCRVCHDTGNLGSPRLGDKDAWQPRIAQGKETLYRHALTGFTGKMGTMPPKGNSTAPDADVKTAVDYMVSKAQ